ncbi:hypothetical protein L2E82_10534 [Cichorium intybus]|uniref:Uncharacterized protein n=1 Tax=Cichorium intybus TaxID=13427 RepID=A0ACB9GBU5_CICIN|nr:hypothetical protein L2E82_10534 [Cichorium intybus]
MIRFPSPSVKQFSTRKRRSLDFRFAFLLLDSRIVDARLILEENVFCNAAKSRTGSSSYAMEAVSTNENVLHMRFHLGGDLLILLNVSQMRKVWQLRMVN